MATCTRARARRCADMHPRRAAPSATRRGEEQRLGPGRAVVHLSNATTACSAHHSGGYGEHRRREKLQLRCHDARALTSGRAPSVGPRKRWTSEYRVTTPSPTKQARAAAAPCARAATRTRHTTQRHTNAATGSGRRPSGARRQGHGDHGHTETHTHRAQASLPLHSLRRAGVHGRARSHAAPTLRQDTRWGSERVRRQRVTATATATAGRYVRPQWLHPAVGTTDGRSAANARRCTQSRSGPQ
jgi:hypothetical protein